MFTAHHAIQQTTHAAHVVHADAVTLLGAISVEPTRAPSAAAAPQEPTRTRQFRMRWTADSASPGDLRAIWI